MTNTKDSGLRTTTTRRVVVYLRISKAREEQTSLRSQRTACERYCKDRGWELVEVCTDDGKSAYKPNTRRPGLDRAFDLIRSGACDTLMVWKLDRFVRSTLDFARRWEVLTEHSAQFVSISDRFDTTSAMGEAMLNIAVVFAQLESAIKSERAASWHDDRAALGRVPVGQRAYGYQRTDRNQLVVVPAEAKIVREAARKVLKGVPLRAIVADLDARGVLGKNGKPISRRGLVATLLSPTIAGGREVDGVLVESTEWKAILDPATWQQVRDVLRDPGRRTGPGPARRWLLSGIATCGKDGTPMGAKPHKSGTRYYCPTCGLSIEAARTDEFVERDVLSMLDKRTWQRLRRGRPATTTSSGFKEAMDVLTDRFELGELDEAEFAQIAGGLRRQQRAASTPAPSLPDVTDLRAAWSTLPVDQRRLVVEAITESLVIEPWVRGSVGYDEERVAWTPIK